MAKVGIDSLVKAVAAAGGVVVSNPGTTMALAKVASNLATNPNIVNNIGQVSLAVAGALNSQLDNLGNKFTDGLFNSANLAAETAAQASATFKDYLDKVNDEYAPNNYNINLNQSILSRYGVNINKAYQGLGGYEREMNPHLRIIEKDLISNSYKKFAELQWRAEISDIETGALERKILRSEEKFGRK